VPILESHGILQRIDKLSTNALAVASKLASVFSQMWGVVTKIQLLAGMALLSTAVPLLAADVHATEPDPALAAGYHSLYNLEFGNARHQFASWESHHPDNPMGPVSEAAGLLFGELQRLGVLESQFYADDSAFAARRKFTPDPVIKSHFIDALLRAEKLARTRLEKTPRDRDALFAQTLSTGLKGDYAALIEKRNMASLRYTKEASQLADRVLAVDPGCYDARIASGISNYIIGSMAAPVRWIVRLDGISGDKQKGISELRLTAERGQYLAPFARILLAIAYVREKDKPKAREMLSSLQSDFPNNPLFAREIARLEAQ
jgi:hypothetical protein